MRFLLDENLPRGVAELIRGWGHDVLVVADSSLRGSNDEALWQEASLQGRIIITRDSTFRSREPQRHLPVCCWFERPTTSKPPLL